MAYLDLALAEAAAAGTAAPAAGPHALGHTERTVVRLALGESRLSAAFAPAPTLASERLEAIRRYASFYRRRGGRVATSESRRLRDAGVTELEAAGIRALVEEHRQLARDARDSMRLTSRMFRLLGVLGLSAVPVAAGTLLYGWLAQQLDDRLGALVLSIILLLGLVSPILLAGHPTRTR